MFTDGEVRDASTYDGDAGDELISFDQPGPSRQEQKYWHAPEDTGKLNNHNDTLQTAGGRWVWHSDPVRPNSVQEHTNFSWADEEQGEAPQKSQQEADVKHQPLTPATAGNTNCENLKDYPQLPVENGNEPMPAVSTQPVESTTSATLSEPTDVHLSLVTSKVGKLDPNSRLHFVKYLKRDGRTVKLWECSICSREFQHQYTLVRHLPTHTDERNYHCQECGKSFRQLSTLSQHRAIHSANRPYSCEVCKKTFNRVSTLISHRKTHSGNKSYKCHICPKGFYQKGNLRNHLFTHTNERPYCCNLCGKGFNQQSNLVCHQSKSHPGEGDVRPSRPRRAAQASSSAGNSAAELQSGSSECSFGSIRSTDNQYQVPSTLEIRSDEPVQQNFTSQDALNATEIQWPEWLLEEPPTASTSSDQTANGMVVDSIKTYHMGVALATKQTPFALLRPDFGSPMLVKIVDAPNFGGKQMLVPATAEDLRVGGKVIAQEENQQQIRVPVVATVVPRLQPGGQLFLAVQEPHAAPGLSGDPLLTGSRVKSEVVDVGCLRETALGPCSVQDRDMALYRRSMDPVFGNLQGPSTLCVTQSPPPLPPPLLSPCRGLDLFDPADCMPMGPQITAVEAGEPAAAAGPPRPNSADLFIHLSQFTDPKLLKLDVHLSDSD